MIYEPPETPVHRLQSDAACNCTRGANILRFGQCGFDDQHGYDVYEIE